MLFFRVGFRRIRHSASFSSGEGDYHLSNSSTTLLRVFFHPPATTRTDLLAGQDALWRLHDELLPIKYLAQQVEWLTKYVTDTVTASMIRCGATMWYSIAALFVPLSLVIGFTIVVTRTTWHVLMRSYVLERLPPFWSLFTLPS
jgi:hypothetical protein